MQTAHYRNAMGILLVYDVTNEQSFKNIEDWLKNIDKHTSQPVNKILIGDSPSNSKPLRNASEPLKNHSETPQNASTPIRNASVHTHLAHGCKERKGHVSLCVSDSKIYMFTHVTACMQISRHVHMYTWNTSRNISLMYLHVYIYSYVSMQIKVRLWVASQPPPQERDLHSSTLNPEP
jgi:hypothetical protein